MSFEASVAADGYLDLTGWGKGYVWVNEFCLGRFWDIGPQLSLFLPAPVVRSGTNHVLILELDGVHGGNPHIRSVPNLGTGTAALAPQ